jgi:hypothetical protein
MSNIRKGFWIGLTALAVACGGGNGTAESPTAPAAASQAAPTATLLPLPGEPAPTTGGSATVASGPLTWNAPAGWVEETPRSMMRRAQYRVPGEGGDGECVVYYFGPGQGGDPQSNAARWAGQFSQPDGSSSLEAMSVSRLDDGTLPIQLVEIRGTYDGGMTMTDAPAESRSGHMLLGGIAMAADAPWFFKFTGPEATVNAQRRAFEEMLESLHVGQ